ncbi:protein inscuteable homolog isoform X1 [Seriola lalandi dorsalis]|uniref:INSC spindle orientation adaptor protein n=2 Tax=Seriola lalandi dorsalis TaxID=1841481 RepID=A0A3B4WWF0_SERLL|nr:protein inscuteable homolog isoform X1 [Seriola lalandi dorsalis]XP_023255986.1 protein inscuteable homolog isoform X1 [Seriola lalandi dorsalis]XP_023255987.1 protein inscuteable homolog isoform X1 [Seriola lalandi dorsalis]XP_056244391.1 protein inscuteable homolog [Seriola aureovittata]XP_056244392.1 protein inscuteable homolog [Seriola aureovittata]XP_056244393.1 protein inscuteable homolog [Seriola aureovittata]
MASDRMATPQSSSRQSSSLSSSPMSTRMQSLQVDSVQRWMEDLRHMTEVECMCVLQAKPIGVEEDSQQGELIVGSGVGAGDHVARNNLQTLLRRALVVSTELGKMFQRLEKGRWQRVHSTAVRANCHVRSLVHEYSTARSTPPEMQKYEKSLLDKCMELTNITERCLHTDDEFFLKSMREAIHDILTDVSDSFSNMIDMALANEIRVLIKQIESSDSIHTIGSAISNLLSLTQDGPQLCSIIAKEGAVVALFKICRQDRFKDLYAHALRTVASICCVEEGINQLDKVDGILCLADILTDESSVEAARAEAAAVVAQITSPHHTSTQHLASFLESMHDIVTALIKLCESASCGEVFLLASAALANITFFDSMACEILLQLNAIHILLQACKDRQRVDTPYSKDQVVTILANLSVLEQCASEVLQEQGVERLLLLLGEKPSSSSPSEGAACERVQQKAAVTLARLSRDPDVAQTAIQLKAVPRLIELCRSPTERNNSDSVLVACLAALRRLAAGCPDSIEAADHQQLIKPRLVDSFLLCSNMEESFV